MHPLRWTSRFRGAYRVLPELARRESWPRDRVERLQIDRLNAVWAQAVVDVPYYQRLRIDCRLPDRFDSLDEFRSLVPAMSKAAVRTHRDSLRSARPSSGRWRYTGGSTGSVTACYTTDDAHREMLRAKYRFQAQWGIDIFDRMAFLWGHAASIPGGVRGGIEASRQRVTDRLRNRLRLSAYRLGRSDLRDHLRRMVRFKPAALYGYSTAVWLLATEALEAGVRIDPLRVVILTGEPAPPHVVGTIEQAFGVPAVVEYGCTECQFVAGETPDRTLRVREDLVYLETPSRQDGRYDIVMTVLTNPAFPLFRYVTDDVTDRPLESPAGGFSILGCVSGRHDDLLVSRTGRHVHPSTVDAVFESARYRGVRRYRAHQRADGSLSVALELDGGLPGAEMTSAAGQLQALIEGYPVKVELVERIAPNPSGKHRAVTSELASCAKPPTPRQPATLGGV